MTFPRDRRRKNLKDETGNRHGMLTVEVEVSHGDYLCRCECGNTVLRSGCQLRHASKQGKVQSCGCRRADT